MKPQKLTLETDYKVTGNSTGQPIDTLAIAVDGRDENDIMEDAFNYHWEIEDQVMKDFNYLPGLLAQATRAQLKEWIKSPTAQDKALNEYRETLQEAVRDHEDDTSDLAKEIQEAVDSYQTEQHKEWLYGDYRGNWPGILRMAEKRYGGDVDLDFTEAKGEVYVTIPPETAAEWIENGDIEKPGEALSYLEASIDSDARRRHNEEMAKRAARKIEREKENAYKATRAAAEEVERKAMLQALIDKKK